MNSLQRTTTVVIAILALTQTPNTHNQGDLQAADKEKHPSLAEEMKRLPAVEPQDAMKTFRLEHGFKLEFVATEPNVADPVDACFDENGRMYVAEMRGYPYSEEKRPQCPGGIGRPDAGVIRLLEDTNADGNFNALDCQDSQGSTGSACDTDEDCADELFCNGVESCAEGSCEAGSSPCDLDTETCVEESDECVAQGEAAGQEAAAGQEVPTDATPTGLCGTMGLTMILTAFGLLALSINPYRRGIRKTKF